MAFNVGDLIARLIANTKDFDKGIARAEAGLKKVETTVVRANARMTTAVRGYANTQRLSTAEISAAAAAWDRKFKPAVANTTRSVVLAHAQALKMNEQFDRWGRTSRVAGGGLGRLNFTLASVTRQMVGANAVVGQLVNSIGSMAVGTVVMTGVLAGMAALAFAWRKIGEEAREARREIAETIERLEAIRQRRAAPPGGQVAIDVEAGLKQIAEFEQKLRDLTADIERRRALEVFEIDPDLPGIIREQKDLAFELGQLRERVAAGQAELVDIEKRETEARERNAKALEKEINALNRRAAAGRDAVMKEIDAIIQVGGITLGGFRDRDRNRLVSGQSIFGGSLPGRPSEESGKRLARIVKDVADSLKPLATRLKPGATLFGTVGENLKRVLDPTLISSGIVTGLATSGISAALGFVSSAIGDLFAPTAVEANTRAIEQNTTAILASLRAAAGATVAGVSAALRGVAVSGAVTPNQIFEQLVRGLVSAGLSMDDFNALLDRLGLQFDFTQASIKSIADILAKDPFGTLAGRLSLAQARLGLLDITDPAAQFAEFQKALAESLGGGFGGLGAAVARLGVDTIDAFVAGILGQIEAGTFDFARLGDLSIDEFLAAIGELESLGDSANEAANELNGLSGALRNAPAGFKVALARFGATTGVPFGPGSEPSAFRIDNLTVVSNDPADMLRQIEVAAKKQANRGGTTQLQLATTPSQALTPRQGTV